MKNKIIICKTKRKKDKVLQYLIDLEVKKLKKKKKKNNLQIWNLKQKKEKNCIG